ncbi:MAG TPA: S-methyl-5-thioribose-1-phosphate isomerase [Sphaerochaeta sp.]|nr:S-methyl-5-thioribose-1-phosphate isomerase [Sphaerochaeta sp.]
MVAVHFIDETLRLLDQRHLPHTEAYYSCSTVEEVAIAIEEMVVRGAPAIGAAAAYGAYFAAKEAETSADFTALLARLAATRPTAVNLQWALDRMHATYQKHYDSSTLLVQMLAEAQAIQAIDIEANKLIGAYGNTLIPRGARILTHCNTGSLATTGIGTALGIIKTAYAADKNISVYATETRPRLQGAKLTTWELMQHLIPVTLIPDSSAAALLFSGSIDLVIVGADRIASNGDTANKIGTLSLAVLAGEFQVPFYVAAPRSTIDYAIADGSAIIIEERSAHEVTEIEGIRVAPRGVAVYNPAFDVTSAKYITAIITEDGILTPPYAEAIEESRIKNS